uniref:Uncharacterized protein n=1 Tax=Oryza rufipogon TaxID=4529 RepID=A0A0E0NAD5_ORYRU
MAYRAVTAKNTASSPSPSRRPPASPSRPLAAGEPAAWSRPPAAVPAVRYVVSGPGVLGSRRVLDSLDWTGDAALRSTSPHPPPASSSSATVISSAEKEKDFWILWIRFS